MNKAILLMGPTATGKTDLAVAMALDYPIEIISVDSVLIYRDMNIGSAKPTQETLASVPHHLIDIISPVATYCVADFIDDVTKLIIEINNRGRTPVLVGGTIMYYHALINGISKLPPANPQIRADIENEANQFGWPTLYAKLCVIDPIASLKIKALDKQRISRALEVYYVTGKTISELQKITKVYPLKDIDYKLLAIIPDDRKFLHDRIATRFRSMLNNGLIEEVIELRDKYVSLTPKHTAMRSVGYSQVWQYLDNLITKEELYDTGIAATRQLAKRQITWLRSMPNAININTQANLSLDILYNNLVKYLKV